MFNTVTPPTDPAVINPLTKQVEPQERQQTMIRRRLHIIIATTILLTLFLIIPASLITATQQTKTHALKTSPMMPSFMSNVLLGGSESRISVRSVRLAASSVLRRAGVVARGRPWVAVAAVVLVVLLLVGVVSVVVVLKSLEQQDNEQECLEIGDKNVIDTDDNVTTMDDQDRWKSVVLLIFAIVVTICFIVACVKYRPSVNNKNNNQTAPLDTVLLQVLFNQLADPIDGYNSLNRLPEQIDDHDGTALHFDYPEHLPINYLFINAALLNLRSNRMVVLPSDYDVATGNVEYLLRDYNPAASSWSQVPTEFVDEQLLEGWLDVVQAITKAYFAITALSRSKDSYSVLGNHLVFSRYPLNSNTMGGWLVEQCRTPVHTGGRLFLNLRLHHQQWPATVTAIKADQFGTETLLDISLSEWEYAVKVWLRSAFFYTCIVANDLNLASLSGMPEPVQWKSAQEVLVGQPIYEQYLQTLRFPDEPFMEDAEPVANQHQRAEPVINQHQREQVNQNDRQPPNQRQSTNANQNQINSTQSSRPAQQVAAMVSPLTHTSNTTRPVASPLHNHGMMSSVSPKRVNQQPNNHSS